MTNLLENKVNEILLTSDVAEMNAAIVHIGEKLPVGSLTEEQRDTFKSMVVGNKVFVQDVITEINISGAGILPPFFNVTFIKNDLTLFEQLDAIEANALNLVQKISDLKRICGHEAYSAALAAYKIYEMANIGGIPGAKQAYDKLKTRFDGQGVGGGRVPADEDIEE